MSLLALEGVGKRYCVGARELVVLDGVSLEIEAGEFAVVWGLRRSGRSTLLRVAAGIEAPDTGVVRFDGRVLTDPGGDVLGNGIGYCQTRFRSAEGQSVLEHVLVGLLASGVSLARARSRTRGALERTDSERSAARRLGELDGAEAVRVALARTLALRPRLLLIDEPTTGVDLLERDALLLLLRSLADEGIAVLASTGESTALSGADRALALSGGELRGSSPRELAPVLPLRPPAARQARG